jgi:hypothetical protein
MFHRGWLSRIAYQIPLSVLVALECRPRHAPIGRAISNCRSFSCPVAYRRATAGGRRRREDGPEEPQEAAASLVLRFLASLLCVATRSLRYHPLMQRSHLARQSQVPWTERNAAK